MNKLLAVVVVLIVSMPVFAQGGILNEAQTNLSAKHHKALVDKAEKLLEQKRELEASLAKVNAKLDKLDRGEDVKVEEDSGPYTTTTSGGITIGYPLACCIR